MYAALCRLTNNRLKLKELKAVCVRMKGLEPIRHSSLDPKSNAATNYATCADSDAKVVNNRDLNKEMAGN